MYRVFDFKCLDCGAVEERFVKASQVHSQLCGCRTSLQKTYGPMKPLPAGTRTHFKFADSKLKP